MAVITINLSCDLQKPVKVQYLDGVLFSQDNQANIINVAVYDGGDPASISGTVSANIIRSDGGTVAATGGTISGNVCSITLPSAAYAVPGVVSIIVKLTASSVVTSIAAVVANIYQSSTDATVDPGTIIPSITDLISAIDTAVASIPADYSSLWTSLAPAFNASRSGGYKVGEFCTNDGAVYICTVDHTGAWNSSHFAVTNLGNQLTNLMSALTNITGSVQIEFIQGYTIGVGSYSVGDIVDLTPERYQGDARYAVTPCKEGDKIKLTLAGGNNARGYAFLDADNKLISMSYSYYVADETEIIAPAGSAKIVINDFHNNSTGKPCFINKLIDVISSIQNDVNNIMDEIIIYIRGKGTKSGGDSGVTGSNQYFVHSGENKLKYVTDFTSSTVFTDKTVDFTIGNIYYYKGDFYKYSGSGDFNGLVYIEPTELKATIAEVASEEYFIENPYRFGNKIAFVKNMNINDAGTVGQIITITPQSISEWSYALFNVEEGGFVDIESVYGGNSPRAYCFLDNDNRIIEISPASLNAKNLSLVVPVGATKCIINSYTSNLKNCYCGGIYYYKNSVIKIINEKLQDLEIPQENDYVYQLKNIIDVIGESQFLNKQLTIAEASKYVSWPIISFVGSELICAYAKGTSHTDSNSGTYYKTSPDGIVWSAEKKLLDTDGVRENVTGKGYDIDGCAVFWERIGNDFNLYKFDGDTFSILSQGVTVGSFAHFGDIIKANNGVLLCFWNDYESSRSYGTAKSTDDGETWTITTFAAEESNSEVPTETQGVYLGNDKILAIGRKDIYGGTYSQMQFQSSDNGVTWTKEYTNITDISASTTSMVYDSATGEVYAYYYNRDNGKLQMRHAQVTDVWDHPTSWPDPVTILTAGTGQDAGNVNVVPMNGKHYISFYSGNSTKTAVYDVIRNPSS